MGETTGISWCHHTFNPWWGCVEVSAACDNCYARTWAKRMGHDVWGANASRRFFGDAHWREPLKWNAAAAKAGVRRRVFCASMADVFERHASGDYNRNLNEERARLFRLIEQTPNLDWLLLTKRAQNVCGMIPGAWLDSFPRNVWQGFTAEAQREFDIRWRDIKTVSAIAPVTFVSYEPAMGPLVLPSDALDLGGRLWVIAGGESGGSARPALPEWFARLRDQCSEAGVPFHFKQWGEWTPGVNVDRQSGKVATATHIDGSVWMFGREDLSIDAGHIDDEPDLYRVGKKAAGRLLEGTEWNQFPVGVQ